MYLVSVVYLVSVLYLLKGEIDSMVRWGRFQVWWRKGLAKWGGVGWGGLGWFWVEWGGVILVDYDVHRELANL